MKSSDLWALFQFDKRLTNLVSPIISEIRLICPGGRSIEKSIATRDPQSSAMAMLFLCL